MPKLTDSEADGLRRVIEAEYNSKRAAAEAREAFESISVFAHLEQSADRHISALCDLLHSSHEAAPLLAPATPTNPVSVVKALEAAAEREEHTALLYNAIVQHTRNADLKAALLPLRQSVSHLHLTAIADQLSIERLQAAGKANDG